MTYSQQLDTTDMVCVHNVFREGLARTSTLIRADLNDSQSASVKRYVSTLLQFLASHHKAEDTILWERLQSRCAQNKQEITSNIQQHEQIESQLALANQAFDDWAQSMTIENAQKLSAAFVNLQAVANEHMDHEEAEILPLCAEHITALEWQELPAFTLMRLQGDVLMMVIGLVQDAFTPELREAMNNGMPPSLKEAWLGSGQAMYQETMNTLDSI